jgi:hypothetical protein
MSKMVIYSKLRNSSWALRLKAGDWLWFVCVQLQYSDGVLAFVEPAAGTVESLLGTDVPVPS